MANNPGRITITQGQYTSECVTQYDLIANQAVVPAIRDMLDYANRRQLCTLLTSGVVTPYGIKNDQKTKIPDVESKGKSIGNDAYQFRVMGRIEQPSVILAQVGTSGADGTFTLKMADRHLNKGAVVLFYGSRYAATVMSQPRGSAGAYIYDFQSPSGDVFSWATHVATQPGTKTCFSGWTTFGEKSLKGYGESKFPDMFINHMTIQRDTIGITGDAAARVLWYNFTDATGKSGKGWMYEEIAQQQAKFAIKNERQKWFGVSTMKNTDGSLRSTSRQTDPETGLPIIAGDGFEEQVAGGNVVYGSGPDGQLTIDDHADMLSTLKINGDTVMGNTVIGITGDVGFTAFQKEVVNLAGAQNIQFMEYTAQVDKAGGAEKSVGYTFMRVNIGGSSLIVCQHPLFDDNLAFPERGSDGKLILSGTFFYMTLGEAANMNVEILHKAANGINRAMVEAKLNGMTGAPETIITEEDAMKYAILKQDMINVYNTKVCGVGYPTN